MIVFERGLLFRHFLSRHSGERDKIEKYEGGVFLMKGGFEGAK